MAHRERQRAERQKRKRRSTENGAGAAESPSERKNRLAREALVPLREGERPRVVTVAAIVTAVVTIISAVSTALAIAGTEIDGSQPRVLPLAMFTLGLAAMAWGLWRARYWAVLGFQVLLLFVMLSAAAGLLIAGQTAELIATGLLLIGAGILFFFMVKAMARIQMPQRLPER